jgi:hypothetical protein
MPHLQTLMVTINSSNDFHALKKMLKACQHSLHTLRIRVDMPMKCMIDLDHFEVGRLRLKVFKLVLWSDTVIKITSFGENLDHLELQAFRNPHDSLRYDSLLQALINGNFKSLHLFSDSHFDQLPSILEGNKKTLQTLGLYTGNAGRLIEHLMMNKVRLCSITTLRLNADGLKHSGVLSLAEIFPNVKFLGLRSYNGSDSRSCITTALKHFQHLKAIDKSTYHLIDQSISIYPTCSVYELS